MEPPRIVYLVTEDWSFLSHRLPMARAAKAAGYEVHVIARVDRGRQRIENEGFLLHALDLRRGTRRPTDLLVGAWRVRSLLKALEPAILHNVALQCVVTGSLASLGLRPHVVNALTGLGATFASDGLGLRSVVGSALSVLLKRRRSTTLVQNPDDQTTLERLGVPRRKIALIRGSGVDVGDLVSLPEPDGPFTVGFVSRMLAIKGVRTLIEAWALLRARGRDYRLVLAGSPDPSNPTSIPDSEIQGWCADPSIRWLGHVEDIPSVWRRAHVAVLASSGGEGVPKALLEAAACGRPLIASDSPGCREIAQVEVNAILFPVGDASRLADAIDTLATNPALRERYGRASRELAARCFSTEVVERDIVDLYRTVAAATR